MKKLLEIFSVKRLIVFIVFCLVLFSLFAWSTGILSKKTDSNKFYLEYNRVSKIDKDNLYVYASKEKILNILDHETAVIYFGYSTNPWCRNMVVPLNEVAKKNNVKQIYYYDIKNDRDKLSLNENGEIITDIQGTHFYRELLEELDSVLEPYILKDEENKEIDTEEKRIYVPLVVFVKNGKPVFTHKNTVNSQEDYNKSLTDKELDELESIYQKGFDLIK